MNKKNPIIAGIYGEIKGRPIEYAYFFIKEIMEANKLPNNIWLKFTKSMKLCDYSTSLKIISDFDSSMADECNLYVFDSKRPIFTDDTILSIGTMDALIENIDNPNFTKSYQKWAKKYPDSGYGGLFREWIISENPKPYQSMGNGGAMRVSPIGLLDLELPRILSLAKQSCSVTHNHPDSIDGAQAVVSSVYLGYRANYNKNKIKEYISTKFKYDLDRTINSIQPTYEYHSEALNSVPESIICFLESSDTHKSISNALSFGGDTDTMGMMSGCISAAFYKDIDDEMLQIVANALPSEMIKVIDKFEEKFLI